MSSVVRTISEGRVFVFDDKSLLVIVCTVASRTMSTGKTPISDVFATVYVPLGNDTSASKSVVLNFVFFICNKSALINCIPSDDRFILKHKN